MNKTVLKCNAGLLALANGADYRRDLHEVRASASDYVD
jgi:hypothetical protein